MTPSRLRPIPQLIQEVETTLWERSSTESVAIESLSRSSNLSESGQNAARTYRRKLPQVVPHKTIVLSPLSPALSSSPRESRTLTQRLVEEQASRVVTQRHAEGRNVRLASPDQAAPARRTLLWPIQFRVDGPWYGNYVGPDRDGARANDYGAPAPWSPVDRAAYQHDLDYYAVQEKYYKSEGNESGGTMWLKGATSLDPRLQSGLGWADLKLAIRAPAYFLQGIFDGSYGLDDFSADEKHYKFGADLAWAVAITSTHLLLATHRFGLALLGGIQDLGKAATEGIISFGKRVGGVAGTLIQGIGYAADAVLTAGVFAARIAWTAANALLGVGLVIANFFLMPVITAAAYLGAKIISAVVTVAKAIWGAIKSIGEAIGDFFSSIFVLSEAVRLAVGAGDDVRATMLAFRDGYVRHVDTDGAFLSTYTDSAPLVVAEIDRRPDAQAIWEAAYASGLEPCLSCIRSGDHATAFEHFRRMFEELCDTAGVREGSVWRVRRWKQPLILT